MAQVEPLDTPPSLLVLTLSCSMSRFGSWSAHGPFSVPGTLPEVAVLADDVLQLFSPGIVQSALSGDMNALYSAVMRATEELLHGHAAATPGLSIVGTRGAG